MDGFHPNQGFLRLNCDGLACSYNQIWWKWSQIPRLNFKASKQSLNQNHSSNSSILGRPIQSFKQGFVGIELLAKKFLRNSGEHQRRGTSWTSRPRQSEASRCRLRIRRRFKTAPAIHHRSRRHLWQRYISGRCLPTYVRIYPPCFRSIKKNTRQKGMYSSAIY